MLQYTEILWLEVYVFIIDNFNVFASFYVEGIAGGNVSSRRF